MAYDLLIRGMTNCPCECSWVRHATDKSRAGRGWAKRLRAQSGQVILEFALLVPFLAMLSVGGLEFSRVFIVQRHLVSAAYTGARTGTTVGATQADVNEAIAVYLEATSVGNDFAVAISGVGNAATSDTMVTVSVTHEEPLISSIGLAVPVDALPLSASVTMRHQ